MFFAPCVGVGEGLLERDGLSAELVFVDAEEVFEGGCGEGAEGRWEGGAGEGGLFVVEAEVAGAGAGAGVEVDAGRVEAEVGAEAEGGVVAVEFADAGDLGVLGDEGVEGVDGASAAKFGGDFLEVGVGGAEGFTGEAALVGEAFAVGGEGEGGFAESGGEGVGFEGGAFGGGERAAMGKVLAYGRG